MGFEQERLSRLQLGFNGATLRREWNVRTCADADERGGGASMEPLSGESGMAPDYGIEDDRNFLLQWSHSPERVECHQSWVPYP